eukprot:scaffold81666_cov50-Prasinocladus_malaysianus.AAC.2
MHLCWPGRYVSTLAPVGCLSRWYPPEVSSSDTDRCPADPEAINPWVETGLEAAPGDCRLNVLLWSAALAPAPVESPCERSSAKSSPS